MAEQKPQRPQPPQGQPKPQDQPNLWALSGLGLELAAGIGAFTAIGWWLDRWLATTPWLLVTGATLGFIGGLYNLWRQTRKFL